MTSAFRDPGVEPTPERIGAALADAGGAWLELLDRIAAGGAAVAWRYYRDGGWLARASRGRRTVAWLNVLDGCARITFYFAERDRAVLATATELPDDLRERIAAVPLVGRLLPVTLEIRSPADLPAVEAVLAYRR